MDRSIRMIFIILKGLFSFGVVMESVFEEREELIICPRCGHHVPKTPTCINCGFGFSDLNLKPDASKEVRTLVPSSMGQTTMEKKTDFEKLINYMIWRAKLVWLLSEGKVSTEIFRRIYQDYTAKINLFLTGKTDLAEFVEGLSALSKLRRIRKKLDELMVRHKVGEIQGGEYISKYTSLMSELESLEREATRVKLQYMHLRRVINDLFGGTIIDVKEQIKKCYEKLPRIVGDGDLIEIKNLKKDLDFIFMVLETIDHEMIRDSTFNGDRIDYDLKGDLISYSVSDPFDEELILKKVCEVVKGHDDEIRRIIRAIKMRDNVLIIGRHAEGKTELLLQLHKCLGGIYFHCHEEVSERELIAGFNPSALVGVNPIHTGCLMQIVNGDIKGLPIAFIDEIMKLRPKTQIILFEAMNNKRFINPVDGKTYYLPPEFSVVSSSNIESVVQETPDIAFLDRFGKIIMWRDTPDEAIREILYPYHLPQEVVDMLLWIRHQVRNMRYLVPVSVRNLQKFAQEYSNYREAYKDPEELINLVVDRLLKIRILNIFGLQEFEDAKAMIEHYVRENMRFVS